MLAYDPTGRWLAACSTPGDRLPGEVRVFDATTGQRISLRCAAIRPVSWRLPSIPTGRASPREAFDGTIKLWETETGQEVFTLRGHKSGVLSVAFSPDGRLLATGKHRLYRQGLGCNAARYRLTGLAERRTRIKN